MSLIVVGSEWTSAQVASSNIIGLSNGTFLALSVRLEEGQGRAIIGQIMELDGSLSAPFLVRSVATGSLGSPVATQLSNGRFAIAWSNNTDGWGAFKLESRIFDAAGNGQTGIIEIGEGARDPIITALADGGYAVSYRQQQDFKTATFGSDGAMRETIGNPPGSSHAVASLSNGGHVTVVSTHPTTTGTVITAHLRRPDGQIATEVIAEFDGLGGAVQVVGLANGNCIVAWLEGNTVNARILNPQGQAVGGEVTLYQEVTGSLEDLTVEALPEGGFAIAFVNRITETDVYFGIYSASAQSVVSPGAIGGTLTGSQAAPSIAVLRDGRCVVSWEDQSDGLVHFQAYDPRTKGVNLSGDEADDRFTGTGFGDVLNGGGGADRLLGEGGNDVLNGGLGGDLMFGGAGNDAYYVDSDDDRIVEMENAGIDQVITTVSQDLWDEVENLTALGTGAITLNGNNLSNRIKGNSGQNILNGEAGNDILDGGVGADSLTGGAGNDIFHVDTAGDRVVELKGGGRDTLNTSISFTLGSIQEIEVLTATGSASVTLKGNSIANAITGNTKANKIYGGLGNDQLKGGSGKDIFVFDTKANTRTNKDKILDFSVTSDTIWLENKVFTKLGKSGSEKRPAKLNKDAFVVGAKAKDKNDYLIYDKAKGVLSYDADGSGRGKAVEVATFTKKPALTLADFFVI